MTCTRHALLAIATVGAALFAPAARGGEPASTQAETRRLIAVLQSPGATLHDKAQACERLAIVGTPEAVSVLAKLLEDARLAHYARFALEPMADPSVDEALRAAMERLTGARLVGVINSIGVRRDRGALRALARRLRSADRAVAAAAAAAIGRIATVRSARILGRALSEAPAALRPAIADACLPCAEALLARGRREAAVGLYDAVREGEVPGHVRLAGLRGAILARGGEGVPLLLEALGSGDPKVVDLALTVARELPGPEVSRALADRLEALPAAERVRVIAVLGDRGESAGGAAVLAAAKSGLRAVRIAAIRALEHLGDASAVPVLLEAARVEGEIAARARATLEGLRAPGVDGAIVRELDRGDPRLRTLLIELAGRRRIAAAVPALRKAAADPDAGVRLAAIRALGQAIGPADLPVLTGRLLASRTPEETAAVQRALAAAASRMPDPEACAEALAAAMGGAPAEAKCVLLDALRAAGGRRALEAARACTRAADARVREAAFRVLGEWGTPDAGPALLERARTARDAAERRRALEALGHLLRVRGFPGDQKIALCEKAMAIAERDEEHVPLIGALAGIRAPEALALLVRYLGAPALKERACAAAVTVGEGLVRNHPKAVAEAMREVVQATANNDVSARAMRLLRRAGGKR